MDTVDARRDRQTSLAFPPFSCSRHGELARILTDFKFATEEQWHLLASAWRLYEDRTADENRQTPFAAVSQHRVLRNGISFTVPEPSDTFGEPFIYSESKPHFRKSFRFEEMLGAIHIKARYPASPEGIPDVRSFPTFSVDIGTDGDKEVQAPFLPVPDLKYRVFLTMDQGPNGYELGLSVPEGWWETVKDACPNPITVKPASGNFAGLVLATVPNLEFAGYHHPIRIESRLYKKWFRKVLDEHQKERARLGWREADSGVIRHREIEHKYFYVSHGPIDQTIQIAGQPDPGTPGPLIRRYASRPCGISSRHRAVLRA
jgi:hypothetical protein